jgi:hypothetical protein
MQRHSHTRYLALLLLQALMLSACSHSSQAEAPSAEDSSPASIAQRAVAERLNVSTDELQVVQSEAVDFGSPALGCPQPGMMYAQVITPGYKVIVAYGQQRFDVRVSGKSGRICERKKTR